VRYEHYLSFLLGKTALSKNGWLCVMAFASRLRMEQGWCKKSTRNEYVLQLCSYTREAYLPEAIINLPAARSDPQVSKNTGREGIFSCLSFFKATKNTENCRGN